MKILNVLFEITIYSAVIFFAIMILKLLFKNSMSPLMHLAIWSLLIARLIIPVTFESSVRLFTIPAETVSETAQEQIQPDISKPDPITDNTYSTAQPQMKTEVSQPQTAEISAAVPATQKPITFSTEQIILAVWLTGFGIGVLYLAALYGLLLWRIHKNAQSPSERLSDMFAEVKAELGIRRNIRVIGQCDYGTPAVFFPATVLMPINTLVSMSDDEVKFVLRHELMHIKRCDHIFGLFLSLLNAVYWFNPVVWAAVRQIRADMETACDSDVVRYFSGHEKSAYAAVILSLFSRKQYGNLALGMVNGNTRKIAEKRIKGVFMHRKTNRKVKITAVLLAVLLLFTCFTTACQPTPSTPPVVNKGDNSLGNIIASSARSSAPSPSTSQNGAQPSEGLSALKQSVGAPEFVKDSYTNKKGDVTVTVDAIVEVPSVEKIPAYAVKSPLFSQEFVDKFASYFFKNTQIVTNDYTLTKSELMDRIIDEKGRFEEHKKSWTEERLKEEEAYLKDIEEQYKTAPEKITHKPTTTKIEKDKYGDLVLNVAADMGKGGMATLEVYNLESGSLSYCNAGNGKYFSSPDDIYYPGKTPKGMNLSKEEAEKKAAQCVSDLGIKDMQVENIYYGQYYRSPEQVKEDKQCYDFQFERIINGLNVSNVETSTEMGTDNPNVPQPKDPDYINIIDPESLEVQVDDTGIVGFTWENPIEITSTLSDNVPLKNFNEIVTKAKDYIFYKDYTAYGSTADIAITNIKLNMMRMMQKDKPGEYMIVPVWDFMGIKPSAGIQSYVTINAIDGSNISRDSGH